MKLGHAGPVARTVIGLAMWPVVIAFSPVILLAGEPVNRYVRRRLRRRAQAAGAATARAGDRLARVGTPVRLTAPSALVLTAIHNPLWIALTAPGRWVADRFAAPPAPGRRVSAP